MQKYSFISLLDHRKKHPVGYTHIYSQIFFPHALQCSIGHALLRMQAFLLKAPLSLPEFLFQFSDFIIALLVLVNTPHTTNISSVKLIQAKKKFHDFRSR